jgi:DNA (cytosine-5)-methyltransferase 1
MVAEAIGLGSRAESSPANRVHLCLRSPHHVKKLLRQSQQRRPTALREDSPPYHVNVNGAHNKLRFIDLFCGIGGFRLAFERAGCECVFSCDWNEKARETYKANFGEAPHGDIHAIAVADIPEHDILCAGFPCQPFSIAGVSKKLSLGRKHGFEDKEQGNLFFSLAEIIEFHQPAAFVLENVKNLRSHDQGRTFQIIMQTLEEHLGYRVYPKVIDAQSVVPQHRERINLNSEKFLCGGNE